MNRLEAEKLEADLSTLDVGECLVQLNDESTVIPAGCRVGLSEHSFLLLRPLPPSVPVMGKVEKARGQLTGPYRLTA